MDRSPTLNRRQFSALLLATGALGIGAPLSAPAAAPGLITRPVPRGKEALPVIGMGSSITFNVGDDPQARDARSEVLKAFFAAGGRLIDSSPMYGSSEAVIGHGLQRLPPRPELFSATKVWTWRSGAGPAQMEQSRGLWGVERFDLMQIHNLVSWQEHLQTLLEMKSQQQLRYIGITTSHGRRHGDLAEIMRSQPIDFVQFSYNVLDREAEKTLLPLARERRLAVIINRPFQRGRLFDHVSAHTLPDWAAEFDCSNWAQFFLKWIVSHPDVTSAIPATSRVDHMMENMGAGYGHLPDQAMRQRMARHIESL